MHSSDDYGFDDFVLQPQALALLDEIESQYEQSRRAQAASTPNGANGHVNKRTKTTSGWTPGIGARPSSTDEYDDLPEISVRDDGTYGFGSTSTRPSTAAQKVVTQGREYPTAAQVKRVPQAPVTKSSRQPQTTRPPNQYIAPGRELIARQATPNRSVVQNKESTSSSAAQQLQELQKKLEEVC